MHELSIALSIIEGVEEELGVHPGAHVAAIHVKIGPLSGVVKDALLFSYGIACEGTPLAGSKIEFEDVPVALYCPNCKQERPAVSPQHLACAVCGTLSADIRSGAELQISALELIDECAAAAG